MKLITRRILFIICVIVFLISSPPIILYAFGFRYDFAQQKIVQTGIIYLTPNIQDNIKIFINNKEEQNNVSVKGIFKKEFVLYNLLPRTYNIKVEKENYHLWEKNLIVLPGLITYAQPMLLPSSPKINLVFSDSNIPAWTISDTYKKIFYLKNDNDKISANIYDFSNNSSIAKPIEKPSNHSQKTIASVQNSKSFPAPDGKKFGFIISQDANRIILLNSADKDISVIADFVSNNKIIDENWDGSSRYLLYLNEKGEVNSIDTENGKTTKILENVIGFSLKNEDIYYLNKDSLFFYKSSINNPLLKQQLSYVPLDLTGKNEQLENTEKSDAKPVNVSPTNIEKNIKIYISDKNNLALITPLKSLYLINQNGVPVNLGNNIESAVFSKDGGKLVYNSSFEIYTYDLGNGQENLITRLSQKISNVSWHDSYTHVWFLTNQTLKNIELDSRPTPNIIDFVNIAKEPGKILYTDNNFVYYDQPDNNGLAIYQVEIQN